MKGSMLIPFVLIVWLATPPLPLLKVGEATDHVASVILAACLGYFIRELR